MGELIPLEVLLGNPEKAQARISPDGTRLSYLAPVNGVLNVWVGHIGRDDFAPITNDTDRGIQLQAWCHDDRHLLYIQDQGGDENWRLYTVDPDTGEIVDRTPFEGVQARLIAHRKEFPNELLIGLNKDNPQLHDVYHLDLRTGDLKKVADNPGFLAWVVDADLKVRGSVAPQPDGGFVFLVRDTEESDWRPMLTVGLEDGLTSGPVGFTKDGRGMYVSTSVDANAARLLLMDLDGRVTAVLAEDPTYDVVDVHRHLDTHEPQIVWFLKERLEAQVLDPAVREDVEAIRRIHDGDFHITDRDRNDSKWMIAFDDDAGPLKFYVFDRNTKQATFLFDHRPELNQVQLAAMEPFSYKARDGLEVHGYLTFPAGGLREDLPTVINVHGGPWARDAWGFNPEVQWLADRGYLCVQVNFRGSTGYGKDFVNAGDREWGGKMQDDITDAVAWVIDQGYADPDRVGILGWSYGGYATLAGATFTPDLYRCAVAGVGVSNIKTWIETFPPYWAPMIAMAKKRVGDPETEEEFLWSRSPLSKVDNIKIPILIGHGANDPRVKLAETEQIVDAMRRKGIDHELMVFEDEGHGFVKPENRLKFYRAAERFLAAHLGGRAES